jgi:hypothetical protein
LPDAVESKVLPLRVPVEEPVKDRAIPLLEVIVQLVRLSWALLTWKKLPTVGPGPIRLQFWSELVVPGPGDSCSAGGDLPGCSRFRARSQRNMHGNLRGCPGVPAALIALGGGPIDPSAAELVGSYNQADDTDLDGRSDDVDNCPFVSNSDQLDRGKLASLLSDGIGDLCQCGESTGDGSIFSADVLLLRQLLAGQGVSQPLLVQGRCSVQGTPACDVADVALLRRALSGMTPTPRSACRYAVP